VLCLILLEHKFGVRPRLG